MAGKTKGERWEGAKGANKVAGCTGELVDDPSLAGVDGC